MTFRPLYSARSAVAVVPYNSYLLAIVTEHCRVLLLLTGCLTRS
jgi:hypothetical protein